MSVVLANAYGGVLFSFLSVTKLGPAINSLNELAVSKNVDTVKVERYRIIIVFAYYLCRWFNSLVSLCHQGNYGPYSSAGLQQQNQGTGYSSSSYQQSGGSSSSYPASYNHQQGNLYEASPPSYAATGYESRPAYPYSPLNYGSAPVYQHVGYTRPLASAYNNNPTMMGPSSYSGNSRGYGAASPYNPYPTSTNYQQHNDGYDNSFLYQHYIEPYMYGQMTYY